MEKYGTPGSGLLLCPAERLQMALRIKSKSVLTAREWVLRHIRCHARAWRGRLAPMEEAEVKKLPPQSGNRL